jgi:hypothetical protein
MTSSQAQCSNSLVTLRNAAVRLRFPRLLECQQESTAPLLFVIHLSNAVV